MIEILRLENISHTYQAENGEVSTLKNINFTAYEGELISIIGPSGCGKTTLLSIIAGLIKPTSGTVFVRGDMTNGLTGKIGYMLQKDNLLDWRTIRSNVRLGLEIRGILNDEHKKYADILLQKYGLWEFRNKHPAQLSGGMRQRAALIRTLAVKPEILLLDEAFSGLDYQTRFRVVNDVFSILKQENKTAMLITHDILEGISISDRLIVLTKRPGHIYETHKIKFPAENGKVMSPLKRRNDKISFEYLNLIMKGIDVNE